MKKENKMNNKGFSLVELIIVIAIMAILVGVLAPTYMQYVEKTRKSRDISAVDSMITAIETTLIDAQTRAGGATALTATITKADETLTVAGSGNATINADLTAIISTYDLASSEWADGTLDGTQLTAVIDTDGTITWTDERAIAAMCTYSDALNDRIN